MPISDSHLTRRPRKRTPWLVAVAGLSMVAVVTAGCGALPWAKPAQTGQASIKPAATKTTSPAPLADNAVIATYTGGKVTKAQFEAEYNTVSFLEPLMSPGNTVPPKAQFIKEYVSYFRYLVGQAEQNSSVKKAATAEVNQGYPQFMSALTSQFKTKQGLETQLKAASITDQDLKNYMYDDALLSKYLQQSLGTITVTTAQVQTYMKQNIEHYTQVHAVHILVKTLKTAQMIEGKLKAGTSFATLAKRYSIDTGSKVKGGDLGSATADTYVAPFAKACMTLPLNTVSAPVHSQFGYHIIKVLSRTVLTAQAKTDLVQQKQTAAESAFLSKAQKAANVKLIAKTSQL